MKITETISFYWDKLRGLVIIDEPADLLQALDKVDACNDVTCDTLSQNNKDMRVVPSLYAREIGAAYVGK
jgi:hypothetical protein